MPDMHLRLDIIEQLDFDPAIDASCIDVAVDCGVATLTGHVRTLAEKTVANEIVESIKGVRVIADEIEVRPRREDMAADDEIAVRVTRLLRWSSSVPEKGIRTAVFEGTVTLEGEVDWRYQSQAAEKVIQGLIGVTGIINLLDVKPVVSPVDVSAQISKALIRDAELDSSGIRVTVENRRVILEGQVRYLGERRSATRAAWAVPGVTEVVDRLSVE